MADVLKNATKRIKIRKKSKSQCEDDGRRSPRPPTTSDHCSTMDPEREKEIFKVFQTFDLDGEDKTRGFIPSHCRCHEPGSHAIFIRPNKTRDCCEKISVSGNGTISVKEMVTCLNAMGKKITFDEVVEKFHRIDKDGNHEVDYDGKASPNANVKNKVQLSRDTTHIQGEFCGTFVLGMFHQTSPNFYFSEFKKMMES